VKYLLWKLHILKLNSAGKAHLKKLENKREVESKKAVKKPQRHHEKHIRHQERMKYGKKEVPDSRIDSREEQDTVSIPLGPFIGLWLLTASLLLVLSGTN
jgi:hypothetical protein